MDAVTALVEHVCEQLQLLSASFERCLLVVEGSPAFLAQTWARAEVLYVAAERADILLKLLTSSGACLCQGHARACLCQDRGMPCCALQALVQTSFCAHSRLCVAGHVSATVHSREMGCSLGIALTAGKGRTACHAQWYLSSTCQ